jgi:hypothetical protein
VNRPEHIGDSLNVPVKQVLLRQWKTGLPNYRESCVQKIQTLSQLRYLYLSHVYIADKPQTRKGHSGVLWNGQLKEKLPSWTYFVSFLEKDQKVVSCSLLGPRQELMH